MNELAKLMQSEQSSLTGSRVAIIGGGIAGATAAVHLAELGIDVTLIEKGASLVSGPPICHLHAGGNLYREISTEQCIVLLKQSIDTVRLFPHTINNRPTVIAVPHSDGGSPEQLLGRLDTIQQCYQQLVDSDKANEVLGKPKDYYKLYTREQIEALAKREQPLAPSSMDEWVIPFAKHAELDALKFPVVVVSEPGWSVFRLAASATLALEKMANCQLMLNTKVVGIEEANNGWKIEVIDKQQQTDSLQVDYLVNACGYETGSIDDLAKKRRQRLVEFKAAYVTRWQQTDEQWPEVIFHGPRGTDRGMAQLTPYPDGVFQLHGMTKDITLFDDGLVASEQGSSQPQLPPRLLNKLNQGWDPQVMVQRSRRAIEHMAQFIPDYASADEYGTPLFGAQQIPGQDETLRAADVTFEGEHYARIEVVKGSSALEAAMKLVKQWQLADDRDERIEVLHPVLQGLTAEDVELRAEELARSRAYPAQLAQYYGE